MLAHYHGQLWNSSDLARSLGLSDKALRSYLDILTGTFMIRQLQPWFENISKRQVKAPQIYFRDSGLYHHLMGIDKHQALQNHPKLGASREGFALESFLRQVRPAEACFWSTYSGAELDLFYFQHGKRYGVEVKFSRTPTLTKSMESAYTTLQLDHLWVLAPTRETWSLCPWATVIGLEHVSRLA